MRPGLFPKLCLVSRRRSVSAEVPNVEPQAVEGVGDDPREALAEGLSRYMTRPQVDALLNEALSLEKQVWFSCPNCKKSAKVSIPDAKATVGAVSELLTQGFGRPAGEKVSTEIVVNRSVAMVCDHGHACLECEAESLTTTTRETTQQ